MKRTHCEGYPITEIPVPCCEDGCPAVARFLIESYQSDDGLIGILESLACRDHLRPMLEDVPLADLISVHVVHLVD